MVLYNRQHRSQCHVYLGSGPSLLLSHCLYQHWAVMPLYLPGQCAQVWMSPICRSMAPFSVQTPLMGEPNQTRSLAAPISLSKAGPFGNSRISLNVTSTWSWMDWVPPPRGHRWQLILAKPRGHFRLLSLRSQKHGGGRKK